MKPAIKELRNERQWRAATGLDEKRFHKLLRLFKASYLNKYGHSVGARQAENPTLSEAIKEAAHGLEGHMLNF